MKPAPAFDDEHQAGGQLRGEVYPEQLLDDRAATSAAVAGVEHQLRQQYGAGVRVGRGLVSVPHGPFEVCGTAAEQVRRAIHSAWVQAIQAGAAPPATSRTRAARSTTSSRRKSARGAAAVRNEGQAVDERPLAGQLNPPRSTRAGSGWGAAVVEQQLLLAHA